MFFVKINLEPSQLTNLFCKAYVVEDSKRTNPIANFHRRALLGPGPEKAYLELLPGYEGTLDSLVGMDHFFGSVLVFSQRPYP